MGIISRLGEEMENLYNHWTKVQISDKQAKRLIEIDMAPTSESLTFLKEGNRAELSSHFIKTVENVVEFAFSAPSQLEKTTRGALLGAYNAVTGYFQNVKNYTDTETKLKSIMTGNAFARAQGTFDLWNEFAKSGASMLE